ncbi:MAG TPA: hypothetical protein VF755_11335 [Catenuloplanes sp.]
MGRISARTTSFDFDIDTQPGETVLSALRRSNLPASGFLLQDDHGGFMSLARVVGDGETVTAHSLRNPDFSILDPAVQVVPANEPVAEIFAADGPQQTLTLVQFNRQQGIDYIYRCFATVLDDYRAGAGGDNDIQIALSGGGDGRIVGECAGRYQHDNPGVRFHAVITANGFEDETGHLTSAVRIAQTFGIAYTMFDEAASAQRLGFADGFGPALDRYREQFPDDEAEVLATYWVQELNLAVATETGRRGIIFGFNQEDVIAERLYQALSGKVLPPYPVRATATADIIAPLYKIPKRLIDALDLDNSMTNYERRQPSVSYLRSALYFVAYQLIERFPTLAAAYADPTILARASEDVPPWLITPDTP